MTYYQIGYGDYDGSEYVQLMHDSSFGQAEFEALCFSLLPECVASVLDEPFVPRAEDVEGEPYWQHCEFATVYELLAELLVERHGFRRVEYAAHFRVIGSGSLMDPAEHEEIAAVLADAGYTLDRYPDVMCARKKGWNDLSPEWRERFAGYDAGSWADAWDDSIPEDRKRQPSPQRVRRPRRKRSNG